MSLSMTGEKQALINMMRHTTLEVTPGGAEKVADFRVHCLRNIFTGL